MAASSADVTPARPPHIATSSMVTVISIALVCYALADVVHEWLGHGLLFWLFRIEVSSISTVGVVAAEFNRMASAGGTLANVTAGALAWLLMKHGRGLTIARYGLWLFGFVNLMNVGYLFVSAFWEANDWGNVIWNLNPHWLWRIGLGMAGAGLYSVVVYRAAALLRAMIAESGATAAEIARLTVPAYLTGGVLLTIAAVFNPMGLKWVLLSGAGATFLLTCGLLIVNNMVGKSLPSVSAGPQRLPLSRGWIVAACLLQLCLSV